MEDLFKEPKSVPEILEESFREVYHLYEELNRDLISLEVKYSQKMKGFSALKIFLEKHLSPPAEFSIDVSRSRFQGYLNSLVGFAQPIEYDSVFHDSLMIDLIQVAHEQQLISNETLNQIVKIARNEPETA